jgi:hypothetical protein
MEEDEDEEGEKKRLYLILRHHLESLLPITTFRH